MGFSTSSNGFCPNGTFIFTGKEADSVVLIGGGVGITPMKSVARYLTETCRPGKLFLLKTILQGGFVFLTGDSGTWGPIL